MAKFDKIAVLNKIGSTGMVPVFYHKDAEVAKKVVKACYDGGVRAFEFTNRGDFAHEVFAEVVKFAAKECPEMAMGVGSIVAYRVEQLKLLTDAAQAFSVVIEAYGMVVLIQVFFPFSCQECHGTGVAEYKGVIGYRIAILQIILPSHMGFVE